MMDFNEPREDPEPQSQPPPQIQEEVNPPNWEWQQQQMLAPQIYPPTEYKLFDFPKQIWIVIAIAFALGLFMGKSLQPIILKSI